MQRVDASRPWSVTTSQPDEKGKSSAISREGVIRGLLGDSGVHPAEFLGSASPITLARTKPKKAAKVVLGKAQ
jgi:hypothetical protein